MSGIRGDDRVNMMDENPELRWSFIHKVYSITIFQLLLTIAVFSVLLFVPPIAKFFNYNYYVLFTIAFFALLLVEYHHQKHPLCYFLLLIFTVSFALSLGLICVDYLSSN
ncbi:hypothetical protein TSUD_03940 [Trifolium subterraneum]|nr:hypothetical protein TSUD_03940 [Trifolium subterraneum]